MENMKKGMSWLLVCVMLMGLIPINVSSAVDGAATASETAATSEGATENEKKTETATAVEVPNTEDATEVGSTTEAVPGTEGTTEAKSESAVEAGSSTESTTEITSEESVNTENNADASENAADTEKTSKTKLFSLRDGFSPLENNTTDLKVTNVSVNDESGNSIGDQTVKNRQKLHIILEWELSNVDNNNAKPGDKFVYVLDPVQGVNITGGLSGNIPDPTNSGKIVGTFTYENGTLTLIFDDTDYLGKSNKSGTINMEAEVNLEDIPLEDNGDGQIQIGEKKFNIHVKDEDRPSEIHVKKEAGNLSVDSNTGLPMREFTITVTSAEDADDVRIEDFVEEYLLIDKDSIHCKPDVWTPDAGGCVEESYGDPAQTYYTKFAGTISHIAKGDSVTITYTVYGKKALYGCEEWNLANNQNTVTAKGKYGEGDTAKASFDVKVIKLEKGGSESANFSKDGVITWTIKISNEDGVDLAGTKLTDILGQAYYDMDLTNVETVVLPNGDSVSVEEFLEDGYTFGPGSTDKSYTITYTTIVEEGSRQTISDITPGNTAYLENDDYTLKKESGQTLNIKGVNPLTGKTGKMKEGTDNTIVWTSTLEIPDGGMEGLVYHDYFDDTLTLVESSIAITGLTKDRDYTVTKKENGFEIRFTRTLDQGSYEITYETTFVPKTSVKQYNNTAYVSQGSSEGEEKTARVTRNDIVLNKSAISDRWGGSWPGSSAETNRDVFTWMIEIPDAAWQEIADGNYTIQDTLPEGCEYVKGSVKATPGIYQSDPVNTEIGVTQTKTGVTFDISSAVDYAKQNSWSGFCVTYQTRMTDLESFLKLESWEGLTFENNAKIYKDNELLDAASAAVTAYPAGILSKNGVHNRDTAPYADYTIDVNKYGYDLLKGKDTLTVRDTLPEKFSLMKDTIQVYDGDTNDLLWPGNQGNTEVSVNYDRYLSDGELEIKIPDSRYVVIKYSVLIKMNAGTDFTDENATNTVEIVGLDTSNGSASYSFKGKVAAGWGTTNAVDATLTIYKYSGNRANLLSGAKFQLKMVKYVNGGFTEMPVTEVNNYKGPMNFTTGEDGTYKVDGLVFDHIYEITEIQPPDGYQKDTAPIYFVFISQTDASAYPDNVKIYDYHTDDLFIENKEVNNTVFFSKQAVGGTEELSGAVITLYDADGNVVTSWVSGTSAKSFKVGDETLYDEDGNVIQLAAGTYTMRETRAPDGYGYAEDITFTIDADGKISTTGQNGEVTLDGTKLVMRDRAIGYIYISKQAIDGNEELPGAQIVLKERESGKVIAEWTSGTEPYKLAGGLFKAGTEYVLIEKTAPKGYAVTTEIIFQIDRNGKLLFSKDNKNEDADLEAYNGASYNNQIIINDVYDTTEDETTGKGKKTNSKKTGDQIPVVGMALLYGMSLSSIMMLQRKKKQKK